MTICSHKTARKESKYVASSDPPCPLYPSASTLSPRGQTVTRDQVGRRGPTYQNAATGEAPEQDGEAGECRSTAHIGSPDLQVLLEGRLLSLSELKQLKLYQ